jgi:hypothetical protein
MIARQLTTTDQQLYLNGKDSPVLIAPVWIVNTTAAKRTVRIHHVLPGETAQSGNAILYDSTLAANSSMLIEMPISLGAGEQIRGLADAAGVNVLLYGLNYA